MSTANENDYARMSPRDKLAAARLKARKDSPYFSAALLGLIPRETPGLGTLGVTEKMVLLWDPAAVDQWPLEELSGVLEHEIMHILRDHAGRARRLGILDENGRVTDPALAATWNVAGDCEINDDLEKARPHLFVGERAGLLPKQFKFKDGQLAETYYNDLRKQATQQQKKQGKSKKDGGDEGTPQSGNGSGNGESEEGEGRVRAGKCGSCAGNPLPDEPQSGTGKGPTKDKPQPQQGAGEGEGRTQHEVDRIRKQVAREIVDAAQKGRGNIPGGWLRWAEERLTPPKVRWQDKLARLTRAAVAWKTGQVDLTRNRVSRRQWGIGIGAGRPLIAALRSPVPKIAVPIDTSGSMGTEELTMALRETAGVLTAVGAQVTMCTCDASVHGLARVRSINEVRSMLKGGGGTDFVPVFEALERAPGGRPDIVIFITDGGGPAPLEQPAGMRVIWVLVGKHRMRPMSPRGGLIGWGEFVEIDD